MPIFKTLIDNQTPNDRMLKDLLSDIVRVDDVLMIVKSNGATRK
jgi:hypothetical protein